MKHSTKYLTMAAAAAAISFVGIGCTTVETREAPEPSTRSTTVTTERQSVVAPVGPASTTTTRSSTYRSY